MNARFAAALALMAAIAAISTAHAGDAADTARGPEETLAVVVLYYECDADSNDYSPEYTHGPKVKVDGDLLGYLVSDSQVSLVLPKEGAKLAFLSNGFGNTPALRLDFVPKAPVTYLRYRTSTRGENHADREFVAEIFEVAPEQAQEEMRHCESNTAMQERARSLGIAR